MDEAFNFRTPREREKESRTPEDLRRTLGRIYPEEVVDELMKKLGFEDAPDESCAEEHNE